MKDNVTVYLHYAVEVVHKGDAGLAFAKVVRFHPAIIYKGATKQAFLKSLHVPYRFSKWSAANGRIAHDMNKVKVAKVLQLVEPKGKTNESSLSSIFRNTIPGSVTLKGSDRCLYCVDGAPSHVQRSVKVLSCT